MYLTPFHQRLSQEVVVVIDVDGTSTLQSIIILLIVVFGEEILIVSIPLVVATLVILTYIVVKATLSKDKGKISDEV
jgi:hypothetical protein